MIKICKRCKTEDVEFRPNRNLCRECERADARLWKSEHKEQVASYDKQYRVENKETLVPKKAEYDREYRQVHKDEIKEKRASYFAQYREANREMINLKVEEHRKAHLEQGRARASKRKAVKLQAMPKWLTREHLDQIEERYLYAHIISETTGVPHEVDHIVPLQGKNVSGLHVPWNMQILTREENRRKGRKLIGEYLER